MELNLEREECIFSLQLILEMSNEPTGYITERVNVPEEFKSVFSHFYFAGNDSDETIKKRLLPSFQTILVFSFGHPVELATRNNILFSISTCLVVGPIKQAFDYTLPPGSSILVVNFKDDAFFRFFGPLTVLNNSSVHPDELINENCFTKLWSDLKTISGRAEQVNFLLAYCKPYLADRHKIAVLLSEQNDPVFDPIKNVALLTGLTERSLQMKQKELFGFSAKESARYFRFLIAVQQIQALTETAKKIDWFEIIDACGYYDQSHLIHDFRHFSGFTPAKYVKFQQDLCSSKN